MGGVAKKRSIWRSPSTSTKANPLEPRLSPVSTKDTRIFRASTSIPIPDSFAAASFLTQYSRKILFQLSEERSRRRSSFVARQDELLDPVGQIDVGGLNIHADPTAA